MRNKLDLLSVTDLKAGEIRKVMRMALKLKKTAFLTQLSLLKGKSLAMIFEKPSLRTRVSFEAGMTQLGGHAIYLGPSDIQMGKRETATDVGIVTSSMSDLIMARTFDHNTIVELAAGSSVPVINGLTDLEHPCQVFADFLTMLEVFGRLSGLNISYVGDGNNNVTHSLMLLSVLLGNNFNCASPKGYEMNKLIVKDAKRRSLKGVLIKETTSPREAVKHADVVVADTWISMGEEKEKKKRLKAFRRYQVTPNLMKLAHRKAIFMHCLPAYRGKEVSSEVIDGPQSVVYQEAENRLHAQKALICFLLGVKV